MGDPAITSRTLRSDERSVLVALMASSDAALVEQLADAVIQDSDDGTFGIRFVRPVDAHTRFFETVATAEFTDEDGTAVSVALHADRAGRVMELDFLKADFSPLMRYPTPDQLVMKRVDAPRDESRWETLSKLWRDDIPVGDLANYVARRAAIIVYFGIAWFPLKFLLMILDLLTTGARGGIPDAGYELWRAAFCLMSLGFIAVAPMTVWRSAAKGSQWTGTVCPFNGGGLGRNLYPALVGAAWGTGSCGAC